MSRSLNWSFPRFRGFCRQRSLFMHRSFVMAEFHWWGRRTLMRQSWKTVRIVFMFVLHITHLFVQNDTDVEQLHLKSNSNDGVLADWPNYRGSSHILLKCHPYLGITFVDCFKSGPQVTGTHFLYLGGRIGCTITQQKCYGLCLMGIPEAKNCAWPLLASTAWDHQR